MVDRSVIVISAEISSIVLVICFLKPFTTYVVITITAQLTATAIEAIIVMVFWVELLVLAVRRAMSRGRFIECVSIKSCRPSLSTP